MLLAVQVTREVSTSITTVDMQPSSYSPSHRHAASIPSILPPAYDEEAVIHPPPVSTLASLEANPSSSTTTGAPSSDILPPPPCYSKFSETTRAERCFYYGFLIFPVWIWGFLHFWNYFSSVPETMSMKSDGEIPRYMDCNTGLPLYNLSLPPSSLSSSSTTKPAATSSATTTSSWSRTRPASNPVLLANRPDMLVSWRKEERAWALRCGYAMAAMWSTILLLIFVMIQSGVLGITFSS